MRSNTMKTKKMLVTAGLAVAALATPFATFAASESPSQSPR